MVGLVAGRPRLRVLCRSHSRRVDELHVVPRTYSDTMNPPDVARESFSDSSSSGFGRAADDREPVAGVEHERQEAWPRFLSMAASCCDTWGNTIDEGIQEAVAALWAHGFVTRWSCEGHAHHPIPAPWVTLGLDPSADDWPVEQLRTAVHKEECRLRALLSEYQAAMRPAEDDVAMTTTPPVPRTWRCGSRCRQEQPRGARATEGATRPRTSTPISRAAS